MSKLSIKFNGEQVNPQIRRAEVVKQAVVANESKVISKFRHKNTGLFKVVAAYPAHGRVFYGTAKTTEENEVTELKLLKSPWVAGRTARRHFKALVENTPLKELA